MGFIPLLIVGFGRQNYDWHSVAEIKLGSDRDIATGANTDLEPIPITSSRDSTAAKEAVKQKELTHATLIARSLTVLMMFVLLIFWPRPRAVVATSLVRVLHGLGRGRDHVVVLQHGRASGSFLLGKDVGRWRTRSKHISGCDKEMAASVARTARHRR